VNRFLSVFTANSFAYLRVQIDGDVRHPIRRRRMRILVVREDIAKRFQRLRFEVSESGFRIESGMSSSRRMESIAKELLPSDRVSCTGLF
jgi:hypothetical protein